MKRILLIFALTISLVACSQTQTFTGVKTFTSPPKFRNLVNNNANTKVLTVNGSDVLQWKSASSFTFPVPTLDQVLNTGNSSPSTIFITDDDVYNTAIYKQGVYVSSNLTNGQSVIYSDSLQTQSASTNTRAVLKSDGTLKLGKIVGSGNTTFKGTTGSDDVVLDSPTVSGKLLTDAPIDGSTYVRKDGAWEVNAGGGASTLQDVTDAGNVTTTPIKSTSGSYNAISIDDTANGNGLMNVGSGYIDIKDNVGYSIFNLDLRYPTGNTSLKLLDGTYHQAFVELDAYRQRLKVSDGTGGFNDNISNYAAVTPDGFVFHSSNGNSAKIKLSEPVIEVYPSLNEWFMTPVYGKIPSLNTTAPASATASGKVGEIRVTSTYIYVCTAANTWVRSAAATW